LTGELKHGSAPANREASGVRGIYHRCVRRGVSRVAPKQSDWQRNNWQGNETHSLAEHSLANASIPGIEARPNPEVEATIERAVNPLCALASWRLGDKKKRKGAKVQSRKSPPNKLLVLARAGTPSRQAKNDSGDLYARRAALKPRAVQTLRELRPPATVAKRLECGGFITALRGEAFQEPPPNQPHRQRNDWQTNGTYSFADHSPANASIEHHRMAPFRGEKNFGGRGGRAGKEVICSPASRRESGRGPAADGSDQMFPPAGRSG